MACTLVGCNCTAFEPTRSDSCASCTHKQDAHFIPQIVHASPASSPASHVLQEVLPETTLLSPDDDTSGARVPDSTSDDGSKSQPPDSIVTTDDFTATLKPDLAFRQAFRRYNTKNLIIVTVVAVAQIVIAGINMSLRWSTPPSWMSRIPCSFQPAFHDFTQLVLVSLRFLEFLNIVSAIGGFFIGIYYVSTRWGKSLGEWRPPHVGWLAIIFSFKIFMAIFLFTIINYKLPTYTPYDVLAQSSCEMSLSTIFFPLTSTGQAPDFSAGSNNILRDAAVQYFANPATMADGFGFEGVLADLNKGVNVDKITSAKCDANIFDKDEEMYQAFAQFVNPNPAIKGYCQKGLEVGKEGNNSADFGWGPTEFPVQVLLSYLLDMTNGVALSYYGCSGEIHSNSFPINKNLTFSQVCRDFYHGNFARSKLDFLNNFDYWFNQTEDNELTAPYFGQEQYSLSLRSRIGELEDPNHYTDWYREAACMFIGNLGDPQTGYYARQSVLCSAVTNNTFVWREFTGGERKKLVYDSVASGPRPIGFDDHWNDASWRELSIALYTMLSYQRKENLIVHALHFDDDLNATLLDDYSYDRRPAGRAASDLTTNKNDVKSETETNRDSNEIDLIATNDRESRDGTNETGRMRQIEGPEANETESFSSINETDQTDSNEIDSLKITEAETSMEEFGENYEFGSDETSERDLEFDGDEGMSSPNRQVNGKGKMAKFAHKPGRHLLEDDFPDFDDYHLEYFDDDSIAEVIYFDNTSLFTNRFNRARLFRWLVDEPQGIAQVHTTYMQYRGQRALTDPGLFDSNVVKEFVQDTRQIMRVMSANALLLASSKLTASVSAAMNKVQYLIGTFVGFVAVLNIIPFSMSIITGVQKGVNEFVTLANESKVIVHESDLRKLHAFHSLLILLTGLVTCIPILVIPIFVYQGFADQAFVLTVVGVMLFATTGALGGYLHPKIRYILMAVSAVLIILGMVLWAVFDNDQLLLQSVLYGKTWLEGKNGMWIAGFVINFIFNFWFSRVIACNVVGSLTANMFFDFGDVHYREKDSFVGSKLQVLDMWDLAERAKHRQRCARCCIKT